MWLILAAALLLLLVAKGRAAEESGASRDEKIEALADAIARAEGFYHSDSNVIPRARHNPGDITNLSGSIITYQTDEEGWEALYTYLERIIGGTHPAYPGGSGLTFSALAYTYTGNDNATAWANTVTGQLGISPDWTLQEYMES